MTEIPDYEGLYGTTEDGRIWSYPKSWTCAKNQSVRKSHPGKFLKQCKHTGGYLNVSLTKDGKTSLRFVHRLVAATYIPNPFNLPEVNHKDGNKQNNHYSNLEWVSRQQNAAHAHLLGVYGPKNPVRGERHRDAKLTDALVLEMRAIRRFGLTIRTIAEAYGHSWSATRQVLAYESWTHLP